ncbi:MAG: dipeptide ABC transporter ATP-binding protein [Enterocloster sp.]
MAELLKIDHLTVGFQEETEIRNAVDDISFSMEEGEILGVVGESGSGKSMTALTVMGLLSEKAVTAGSVRFKGRELLAMTEEERCSIQGKEIGMVFQEPMTSLNPVMKIGPQVGESLKLHTDFSQETIKKKTLQALKDAGLDQADSIYEKYPHELSGGMRQRAMIAMAMIHSPSLLIADEPTTALDVLIQTQILKLLRRLHSERNTAILFISHDLNVIRQVCDRVLVMRKGKILESGTVEKIFSHPEHEYTRQLVGTEAWKTEDICGNENVLTVRDLFVSYSNSGLSFFRKNSREVLHNVSFSLRQGEIFGIVGESGCGKSTLARVITGLHTNYKGTVHISDGVRPQMVFQDPFGSLNPARKIGWILEEPLRLRGVRDRSIRKKMVDTMLADIGLDASFADRYPRELSGGQRQRISIGMALSMDSRLLIADEPVSALDVTIQAQILDLLLKINRERKTAILFITHDLNLVYRLCHRAAVLYGGRIIEIGDSRELCRHPKEEYTKKLLEAAGLSLQVHLDDCISST